MVNTLINVNVCEQHVRENKIMENNIWILRRGKYVARFTLYSNKYPSILTLRL